MTKIRILFFMCCVAFCTLFSACGTGEGDFVYIGGPAEAGETAESGSAAARGESDGESGAALPAEEESGEPLIYVYVCGAVKCPGVVALPEGSRADAALNAAGGFREDARKDYVNLAAKVSDGEKLYFPAEGEEAESQEQGGGKVNINTADAAALCSLPGIGETRAADIISYRETSGLFETCEDIMKVPGIKDSTYNKIADKITVN